ncbi:hypothetical protein [Thermoactinomyces mirandus]|uniref:hypothetical protein n=1 Tax=Thermoactinomyces mirandus TaxID=2756294 RepID=UPI001C68F7A0|nr:hypothetical protein [Thermoactinomyces mirandus]
MDWLLPLCHAQYKATNISDIPARIYEFEIYGSINESKMRKLFSLLGKGAVYRHDLPESSENPA